jgi:type II secretory pathway predicted ATPase ExeA
MYKEFFNFSSDPFKVTPDRRFFFRAPSQDAVLESLLEKLRSGTELALLSGPPGTGKTLVLGWLAEQLDASTPRALVSNPNLKPADFLISVCDQMGVAAAGGELEALSRGLATLTASTGDGGQPVVMVDEAENLAPELTTALPELMLCHGDSPRLMVLLVCSDEDRLATRLREAGIDLGEVFRIEALAPAEVRQYVAHRLQCAGGSPDLFETEALRLIAERSMGVPRLVNLICGRALLLAFLAERRSVGVDLVEEAVAEGLEGVPAIAPPRVVSLPERLGKMDSFSHGSETVAGSLSKAPPVSSVAGAEFRRWQEAETPVQVHLPPPAAFPVGPEALQGLEPFGDEPANEQSPAPSALAETDADKAAHFAMEAPVVAEPVVKLPVASADTGVGEGRAEQSPPPGVPEAPTPSLAAEPGKGRRSRVRQPRERRTRRLLTACLTLLLLGGAVLMGLVAHPDSRDWMTEQARSASPDLERAIEGLGTWTDQLRDRFANLSSGFARTLEGWRSGAKVDASVHVNEAPEQGSEAAVMPEAQPAVQASPVVAPTPLVPAELPPAPQPVAARDLPVEPVSEPAVAADLSLDSQPTGSPGGAGGEPPFPRGMPSLSVAPSSADSMAPGDGEEAADMDTVEVVDAGVSQQQFAADLPGTAPAEASTRLTASTTAAVPVAVPETDSGADEEVHALLQVAADHERARRYTIPSHDNAYRAYLRILELEPGNARAEAGIRGIHQRYVARGREADAKGDYAKAVYYYRKALAIENEDPVLRGALRRAMRLEG